MKGKKTKNLLGRVSKADMVYLFNHENQLDNY